MSNRVAYLFCYSDYQIQDQISLYVIICLQFYLPMSSLYQNKILKQPTKETLLYMDQNNTTHKATASFSSKQQRFTYKLERSPGPGSYQSKTNNYKTPEYHVLKNKDKQSPIRRQHQWIWGSGRQSYLGNLNRSSYIGPGSYNVSMKGTALGRHTNWGKSERFYFSNNGNSLQNMPGPGSYESEKKTYYKKGIQSVFKSKSPRTYIQKLISQSSAPEVQRHEQIEQFIQNPEAKNQSNNKQKAITVKINNSFGSKIPRFSNSKQINSKVGPGSYQVQSLTISKSKQKLPKILIVKDEQRKKKIVRSIPQLPGPGSYQINSKTIQKSLEQKGSIIIPTQPRFIEKNQKNPGPGHYMKYKNQYQAELEKALKLKYSPQKPSFNSSSIRCSPELPSKKNPLCNYNLQYYDLQYRVKKNQQHIQKLKIMEVTLPAFNTKAKR